MKRCCDTVPLAASALTAGLMLIMPAARATTSVSIEERSAPVTLVEGESVVVHFDVSKPGGSAQYTLSRDLTGRGQFDPAAPVAATDPITDGGGGDFDPAPQAIAIHLDIPNTFPAGPYVFHVADGSDATAADLSCTIVPPPESQSVSGRLSLLTPSGRAAGLPSDAIIWAYRDRQTPVASAHMQPDGSYNLPLPPGTYLLFAEWFGDLHSQRQVVTVAQGQPVGPLELPLLPSQEVSGTIRDAQGHPLANAPVQAAAADGETFTTQSFLDGSYTLALPGGNWTLTARGSAQVVTVVDQPLDGVDFPPAGPSPPPAAGAITTIAGNGMDGLGGDGRPATAARLSNPQGIAVDRQGNLYIADFSEDRIRKVDSSGTISTVAGASRPQSARGFLPSGGGFSGDGGAATAALLNTPRDVAVDRQGNLFLCDRFNRRVRKVDARGIITTVAGNGKSGSGGDGGLATDAPLTDPVAIAVDDLGNLFIADRGAQRVRRVSPDGFISTVAGGGANLPADGASSAAVRFPLLSGLASDRAGSLYIADFGVNRILKLTPGGTIRVVAGAGQPGFSGDGGPATAARINTPFFVTVDSAGNVLFSDTGNGRIRRISPDLIITTVAAIEASGVAVDAAGDLFFSEQFNHRIQKATGVAAPGLF